MPVATKIAPWASQESSAQLHNFFFFTFFFPTLRLSVWGEWGRMEKEHQNPERKVLSTQPQSHTKRWRDSLCDWYRINQRASYLHTPQSFYSSSSSMLYLMSREEKFTAQHEPEAAGGAHPKWAVDALSLCPAAQSTLVRDTACLVLLPHQHQAAPITHDHPENSSKPNLALVCRTGGGSCTRVQSWILTASI